MSKLNQDKIDAIINGDLSVEEANLTTEELAEVHELKLIKNALRLEQLTLNKAIIDKMEANYSNRQELKSNRANRVINIRLVQSLAACLIIVLGATFIFKHNDSEFDPETYIIHEYNRSETNELTKQQSTAYNLFILKEYDKAIPLLDKLSKEPKDTISQYYLSLCYYAISNKEMFLIHKNDNRIKGLKLPE